MSETKYKEFWIRFRIGDNQNIHQITDVSLSPLGPYPEDFHTIEYSALLEEKQKVKELVAALNLIRTLHKNEIGLSILTIERLIKKYGDV